MSSDLPQPAFTIGQSVQVILNARNTTPHRGTIRAIIWHHKDDRYNYYLAVNGKKISKRYYEDDLEPM